ncbi:MAG: hypothetical protein ABSB70_06335 [Candidatus Velthaea sp.]|jgi:hypothetical protein
MSDVGLDPANSQLALRGCKTARLVFCDGEAHNGSVMVDEFGMVLQKSAEPPSDGDFSLKTLLVDREPLPS